MNVDHVIVTTSPAETHDLGVRLGRRLGPGQVIALHGDLGAGKTALAQGIAAGLGVSEPITSPTFTLINQYRTAAGIPLAHVDCYRLGESRAEAQREAATIGVEELLADEELIVLIEWGELIADLLPTDYLDIVLVPVEDAPEHRRIVLTAHGGQSQQLLQALVEHTKLSSV
ncbi:MAG: tRNA (adenosine(37)-N6)-threonylcarbamoyltransferase complex ATPase subunit type 1 TsaE [Caldilineaceae bacterium]|nr:tRNA (adenosine(37)-N6)-threonylcarbamoyltransferase complex ATPase subunit type 1 TsaE [Caldilineaceae bacterium]